MDTRKITTPRGEFNLREGGKKDGFPVVMLHGWPETSYCWEGVAKHLNPSLRIIAPDLRGLGDSERTMKMEAYQKVELAKDIISLLDTIDINEFFLAGHDWGGIVAQELALLVPERVKRLVILNIAVLTNPVGTMEARSVIFSTGGVPFWYQYFQQMPILPETMIKGNENVWVRFFFGQAGKDGTIDPKALEEYVRCYSIENTPATAAFYYRSMQLDAAHWVTLAPKKFPMPGLYIHGTRDTVIIPAFLNHIEDGFESIEVKTVDAAHFLQEEKPKEVAQLMNDFLK
ncbi:MAG: alpha/beta hydrolase [Proteobacteria bacterium]|nr:alpha/beta hydrolase [Pseudomonadota bacterium]MBU1389007.1 alpha/beta hydrolase [Pseudomonadota bacterium]MBU1543559.1 alpha/beta hydrolase [Pseudomonadota bacterium]MBU2429853.1 alpha/beta hydrolase [Pseudomonadota bacterium]MBU2482110.1 alpha/beta hydrolase [Pseudomonadota bacterium]